MSFRYPAGLITAASPVNTNYPSGVWSTQQAQPYIQNGVWGDDPYFDRTMALLHGDGTNGAQNSSFIDSSANAYAITKSGNTTQGPYTPLSLADGYWSNYFDGSGDSLTRAFTSTTDGMYLQGSTYTIEAWVYPNALSGTQYIYICNASNVSQFGYNTLYLSGTSVAFATRVSTGGTEYARSGGILTVGQWAHIAVSVNSNVAKLFLNGVQVGADLTIAANTFTPTGAGIGRNQNGAAGGTDFNGYISNLRVVQSTAVYTSNFTPSTTPLTAIANTSLLTCQSNRFIDNSTNAFAITRNGDVRVNPLTPFPSTTVYDQSVTGTSGYFDGTGDYLTIASNGLAITTGEFTLEAWIFLQDLAIARYICENARWNFGYNGGYRWGINTNGTLFVQISDGVWNTFPTPMTSANAITPGQWAHVAFVRNASNELNFYINGVSTSTPVVRSASLDINTSGGSGVITSRIGGIVADNNFGNGVFGYIPSLRLVTGTCLYTSNFTPPNPPFSNVTNTQFLCNFANIGMTDNTGLTSIETIGDSQVATTQLKYGNGSIRFDGTGDYLILTSAIPTAFAFGSGDFTIEFWYYSNNAGVQHIMYDSRPAGTNGAYITLYKQASNLLTLWVGGAVRITGTTAIQPNTWYHVACVRFGTNTELYLNGVQEGATYGDTNVYLNPVGRPVIGADGNSLGATPLNGFIDDLRVTLGVARYTANFQPPLARFPNQ